MRKYIEPEVNVLRFDIEDIIATSTATADLNDLLGWSGMDEQVEITK